MIYLYDSYGSPSSLAEAENSTVISLEDTNEDETPGTPMAVETLVEPSAVTHAPSLDPGISSSCSAGSSPRNVAAKKWYQIDFSPTAFCRRVFQSVCSEPHAWEDFAAEKSPRNSDTKHKSEEMKEEMCSKCDSDRGSTQEPIVDLQVRRADQSTVTSPTSTASNVVSCYKDGEPSAPRGPVDEADHGQCCPMPLLPHIPVGDGVYSCPPGTTSQHTSPTAWPSGHRGSGDSEQGGGDPSGTGMGTGSRLLALYEIHEEIGRGSFGVVKRATCRHSGENLAAKFLPLRGSGRARALQERTVLGRLSHPRLACLRDHFCTRRTLVLFMELSYEAVGDADDKAIRSSFNISTSCSNRALLEHLVSKGSVTETQVRMYVHQVLEGLDYIHHMNILHLDIKPDNIMVALSEREEIKICDFGFAQEVNPSLDQYSQYGTPEFVAPEIVCQQPVTKATDIWSLGVLAYLCLTGHCPFSGESDRATLMRVREAQLPWDAPHVACRSTQCLDFLQSVLQADTVVRPSAAECLQHLWFQTKMEDKESNKINSKTLKFFVSRSKWQCSLTCYGSILVLRPIADLLAAPPQETSLASSRSHRGHGNVSSSSSSSSEYDEVDSWATPTSTPYLHREEEELKDFTGTKSPEISGSTAATKLMSQEKESHGETLNQKLSLDQKGFSRPSVAFEPAEAAELQQESQQVSSKLAQEGSHQAVFTEDTSTRQLIPRESLIRSTFHRSLESLEELSPLSARRLLLRQKSLTKRHERSRLRLSSSLSGRLDEPLVEQVEDTPEADLSRSQSLSSLSKSSSLDSGDRGPHSSRWRNRKSRSLDEYSQRALSVPELSEDVEQVEDRKENGKKCVDVLSNRVAESEGSSPGKDSTQERGKTLSWRVHSDEAVRTETLQHCENVSNRDRASGLAVDELDEGENSHSSEGRSGQEVHSASKDEPKSREPSSLNPLFLEAAMPVSMVQDVSELLASCYSLDPLERPARSDMRFVALEKLEVENRLPFPKIHKARSDSRILKGHHLVAVKVHSGFSYEEPCKEYESHRHHSLTELDEAVVATEDYNGTKDVYQEPFPQDPQDKASCGSMSTPQVFFTVPKMVVTSSKSDYGPAESAIEAFSSHLEDKDSSGFLSGSQHSFFEPNVLYRDFETSYSKLEFAEEVHPLHHLDVPVGQDDSEEPMFQSSSVEISPHIRSKEPQSVETALVPYLLDRNRQLTQEKQLGGNRSTDKDEADVLSGNVGLLTVPSEEELHPQMSTSPLEGKSVKLGLLRFFRRQSWTGQPSAPVERVVRRQASDGDSPDSRQQEPNRTLDLSITKKVKTSVSSISKAVLGKQPSKEEKQEGASSTLQRTQEVGTEGPGSSRRTSALFPFRLPGFKRNKEPVFLQELTDKVVSLGQKVTLRCRITGHPTPEIHWYKEARRLKSNNRLRLAAVDREHLSLTIFSAQEEDLGSYRCVASSALGQVSTSCTLIVSELPASPSCPEIYPLQGDGFLLLWPPVDAVAKLIYCIEHSSAGGGWSLLATGVADSCYIVSNLARGPEHRFRVACLTTSGTGPFSEPSAPAVIGFDPQEPHVPLISMDTPWPSGSSITGPSSAPPSSSTHSTYSFLSEISRGRFSVVARCREFPSGRLFAGKITPFTAERRQWALQEYRLLKRLHHTHLAELHCALIWPRHLVLVQELCSGRELLHHLAERDLYGEMHVQDLLRQILSATHYLHRSCVVHLDLRSDNILVGEGNRVKVVDLGSAQSFCPGESLPGEKLQDLTGSQAPEVAEGQGAGPEADVWAIGVLTFIMLSAEDPFRPPPHPERESACGGRHSKQGKVHFGRCYSSLSEGALAFLRRTLSSKPRARPSAGECLQLPWIQGARQATKHRDSVVCFPTDKLRAYLQVQESTREYSKTRLEVPLVEGDQSSVSRP